MTTAWRKVIRDFRQEGARTFLVVIAVAIGISGFLAVLSAYAILTRELDRGYLATNPASAVLLTDAIDDRLLAAVVTNHGVSAAEARRVVTGRIKAGPAQWRNLTLFVVRDYGNIRLGKLQREQGAWPPAAGEILIERDAFQVARARIGDTVEVETARGSERTLRVTGSVHDVGQAQARMENIVYGYITLDTLAQLGEEPYLDQLLILAAEDRFDERHLRRVAAGVESWLRSQGHPVRRVEVPRPGKHPHADIMGLLLLAMASFGLAVLILSSILVINLLTALMAAQVRQIGVMKAIGGGRWQIARIYFAQALLLGSAAILVALPVGMAGGRMLCRKLAVFLNFDIASFGVPPWVYLLVAAIGLAVPLLAAAYPVWQGSGVSVRAALADVGTARHTFGTSAFDRALAGMSGRSRPVLLAMRNSFRRRARFLLTVLTLAAGGLFFMSALNVRASMIHTLDRWFASKRYDLAVNLGTMVPLARVERAIRDTPGVERAEGWIATEGAIGNRRFAVIGLPAATRLVGLSIAEGRSLQPGDTNAMVVNDALAATAPRMKVGNEVNLRVGPAERSWRIVGRAREPFSPPVAYVSRSYADRLGGRAGMTNSVRLVLAKTDPASIDRVRASLEQSLKRQEVRALGTITKAESRFAFDQHMEMIYVFLIVMSCILAGVGGLGLMTTMSLNVLERRREMGVLRAIGASPAAVWLIVAAEGGVIGLSSWALAAIAAWPMSKLLGDSLVMAMFKSGLDFRFEPRGILIWLAVSLSLSLLASSIPAWHAARRPVREAIGYE
jgi:putative ABC transport system permease protein